MFLSVIALIVAIAAPIISFLASRRHIQRLQREYEADQAVIVSMSYGAPDEICLNIYKRFDVPDAEIRVAFYRSHYSPAKAIRQALDEVGAQATRRIRTGN